MGIFKIFKGKVNVEEVSTSVIEGVDKLFFTKEEKAGFSKEIADAQLEYLKTTVSENSARSITRRWLSIGIMGLFLLLIIVTAIAYPFSKDYAQFTLELANSLTTLVMMVAAFFFGGYMVNNHILKKINIKKQSK